MSAKMGHCDLRAASFDKLALPSMPYGGPETEWETSSPNTNQLDGKFVVWILSVCEWCPSTLWPPNSKGVEVSGYVVAMMAYPMLSGMSHQEETCVAFLETAHCIPNIPEPPLAKRGSGSLWTRIFIPLKPRGASNPGCCHGCDDFSLAYDIDHLASLGTNPF